MTRRWIWLVPSKICMILEGIGKVIGIPVSPPVGPCRWGYRCSPGATYRLPTAKGPLTAMAQDFARMVEAPAVQALVGPPPELG